MAIKPNRWFRRIAAATTRPVLVEHTLFTPKWRGPDLHIVVLSDFHVLDPFSSLKTMSGICAEVNGMQPDLIVLAGDFLADGAIKGRHASAADIANCLAVLRARHGVFAILGNHDWKDCPLAQSTWYQDNSVERAFAQTPITLLRNASQTIQIDDVALQIVGLDSQRPVPADMTKGLHRPDVAFAGHDPDLFTILLAHEPDYFAARDTRADLQISGHTHGGQLNLFGWRPIVPSAFGARYAHGKFQDGERQMVVSGGLGFSGVPLRIGQPAEVTSITLQSAPR